MIMNENKTRRGGRKLLVFFLLFLVVAGLGYYNYKLNQDVYVTTYEVWDENLPQAFDGYKIVQVTDVHSIRDEKQADMLYLKISGQEPDAIVITGDLLDSKYYMDELEAVKNGERDMMPGQETVGFVSRLLEECPVYFVYGNHEMVLLDDVENNPFKRAMENIGVVFLNNTGVKITRDDESIYMMGIQDPSTLYKDKNYAGYDSHVDRVNAMMQNIMMLKEEELYTVVLSHRPEYYEEYKKYNVDLFLTGHAHGGQVRFPVLGGLYAPGQGAFPKYTDGVFENGDMTMIIGRGIGNPVKIPRVFNPPEINLIILRCG